MKKWNNASVSDRKLINKDCWFDEIPLVVQIKALMHMDNMTRINFALAYTKYINEIIKPFYWRHFKIKMNNNVISFGNLKKLMNYLNINIEAIDINLDSYNLIDIEAQLPSLFKLIPNVQQLTCDAYSLTNSVSIIDSICDNLKSLHSLNISWANLNSDHLVKIADNLKNLDSIEIATNKEISYGLKYFFEKNKPLKKFGLSQPGLANFYGLL